MPVINPSGLFHGDRLQNLSLMAYLYWPFLFIASNGYGRLEISHHLVVSRLGKFAPAEADFLAYIQEYARAHLLFLYQSGSKVWGAWDTDSKFLPHWKTAEDRRSPEPPEPNFTNWLREYRFTDSTPLTKSSKDFEKLFSGIGVGVGVVGGIGEGKNTCASADANARAGASSPIDNSIPDTTPDTLFPGEMKPAKVKPAKAVRQDLNPQQESWFSEWWAIYWRRVARKPARAAFGRLVTTPQRFAEIMEATRQQSAEMLGRPVDKRPHPASWLNAERWTDEPAAEDAPTAPRRDMVADAIGRAMKILDTEGNGKC